MHPIDLAIVAIFFATMLAFGFWLKDRQGSVDAYFVGDRRMGAGHIGLSVVATDVGGGFSIGLGGLGFTMGLSGSWLLFTGLLGAWLASVLLIPVVKPLGDRLGFLTFPDFLGHRFGERCRALAALVSALGYAGFVGSQLLAGGKLSSAAFGLPLHLAVGAMAVVVIAYTAMGGIKAVILTDTVQWAVLFVGLGLLALPLGYQAVGGWGGLVAALPASHFSLTAVSPGQLLTWALTIVPIWFVGTTLYQRIFATRDVATARRAWLLAGLLEWPLMALMGTVLGMFAAVLFPAAEPEMGLPLLIKSVLPVGAAGLVMAAYFSAIMSTADSCLMAAVSNVTTDLYRRFVKPTVGEAELIGLSRWLVVGIGFAAIAFALALPSVLDSIVAAYSFMVAGLFVPTLAALFWPRATAGAAFWSMVAGGTSALAGTLVPGLFGGVEPIVVGLGLSAATLVIGTWAAPAAPASLGVEPRQEAS
ncbi:Sodium/glucose cotransporter [compost metagenome]